DETRLRQTRGIWPVHPMFGQLREPDTFERVERHRAELLGLLGAPDRVQRLTSVMEDCWVTRIQDWPTRSRVELYGEAAQVLCKAVCTWAGIPISTAVRLQLTRDCLQQVSDGAVGAPWGQSRKA